MNKVEKTIGDYIVKFNVTAEEQKMFLGLIALKNSVDVDPNLKTNAVVYSIFMNPETYFKKFLDTITKFSLKQIMFFTIYAILRKIYSENGSFIVERLNDIKPVSVTFVRSKIVAYLSYSLATIKSIIDKGYDSILDGYNEKLLSENSFKSLIENHNNLMEFYKIDRDDIAETVEGLKKVGETCKL